MYVLCHMYYSLQQNRRCTTAFISQIGNWCGNTLDSVFLSGSSSVHPRVCMTTNRSRVIHWQCSNSLSYYFQEIQGYGNMTSCMSNILNKSVCKYSTFKKHKCNKLGSSLVWYLFRWKDKLTLCHFQLIMHRWYTITYSYFFYNKKHWEVHWLMIFGSNLKIYT